MFTPMHFIGDNKCILIIALNSNNAPVKYEKIREILSYGNYQILDTFNPCILASVNTDHFFASASKIELFLEKGDVINIISCTEKGLGFSALMKRLDNDGEISSILGDLWDIPWMK